MTMVDQNDIAADKYLKTDTITFEELPYIQKYQNLLRLPDKETSLKLFTKQEPEPQQIVILKTRHAENAGKIEKGLQRLKSLEGAIAAKQFQAEQDTAWLDRANMFKTRLLAILPPVFRKEGEIFLNRFIMENLNEDYKEISIPGASRRPVPGANYMPGAHPQKQGFPLKVKTLFYQQQLQKFRDEFNQTNNEYREYYPRFDITRPTETLKKEIAAKYDTAALQAEKGHINAELQRLTTENETISQNMNRLLAAIALKREKFAEIYSKRLFRTDFCDSGVAAALESGLLGGTETEKQYLATLLNTVCEHSPVGRSIIRECLQNGIFYRLQNCSDSPNAHVHTPRTVILTAGDMSSIAKQLPEVVRQSRYAMQKITAAPNGSPSFTNLYLNGCLSERDALAVTCAFAYDVKDVFPEIYETGLCRAPAMLRAYAQAYAAAAAAPANARSLSQDSSAAVNCVIAGANSAALAWDDDFGEFYKKRYCSKTEYYFPLFSTESPQAETPENIMRQNNITIFGRPYLNLQEAVNRSLTVSDEVFVRLQAINRMRENNNRRPDDGINFFTRRKYTPSGQKGRCGLPVFNITQIPGSKAFKIKNSRSASQANNRETGAPQTDIAAGCSIQPPALQPVSLNQIFPAQLSEFPSFNEISVLAAQQQITFLETKGITRNSLPVPALFNGVTRCILVNKSFSEGERLFAAADIVLTLADSPRTAGLQRLAAETSSFYPIMRARAAADCPNRANTPAAKSSEASDNKNSPLSQTDFCAALSACFEDAVAKYK